MVDIVIAETEEYLGSIRQLFLEYAASLDFDLCFQGFEKELAALPGEYSLPTGCLLLAIDNGRMAGCAALRKITWNDCEMKRLYVCPEFRGKEIGKKLALAIIEKARKIGYTRMLLDTVPSMKNAIKLYESLGFKTIDPYCYNPIEGAIFMALDLQSISREYEGAVKP